MNVSESNIRLLLSAIALEEIALAHIVNSEAEKIQYVVGTLQPCLEPMENIAAHDLLAVNHSVCQLMEDVLLREVMLQMRMSQIMGALDRTRML